jgi:microcystin degradation protein MlrC
MLDPHHHPRTASMRIAVGGLLHETNTFVPTPTTWADFDRSGAWPKVTKGAAILREFRDLNLALAHFIAVAERAGHVMAPLVWAMAQPGGRVTDDAFEQLAGTLVEGARAARPDAVFLELHGAMVTDGHDDGEGELLRRMRAAVGPSVPIIVSLDLHANVSPETIELADFISSYRTYPHVDWGPTGARCAEWLPRMLSWGRPARAFRRPDYLIPITSGCSYIEPAQGLYRTLEAIEAETGVHLSLNMGFPPADIFDAGPSITAYGANQAAVDAAADRMLEALLAAEPEFAAHAPLPAAPAVAEAMRIAMRATRPVVLADTQDNPGAGAPSNTTGLIAELLRQRAERAAVAIFHDPRSAEAAHAAGVGGTLDRIGGVEQGPGQAPLPGPWRVIALSDGRFSGTSPMRRASETQMGKSALVQQNGVQVVVASIRQQPIDREVFSHLGLEPERCAILALKSSVHFRSGYQPLAERVIVCLAPGMNIEDPTRFAFTKLRPGVRLRPQSDRNARP